MRYGPRQSLDSLFANTRRCLSRSRRANSMRKHYLSFLSLLFAAFILLGGRAVLKAQQASSSAVKGGRWSDAATWSEKKVPAAGAIVIINQGMDVDDNGACGWHL